MQHKTGQHFKMVEIRSMAKIISREVRLLTGLTSPLAEARITASNQEAVGDSQTAIE